MKNSSVMVETVLLRTVVVLAGIGVLVFLLWEPQVEGRNANATAWEVYFNDPLLAYAYLSSSAFYVALYQVFKLLGFAGTAQLYSSTAIQRLRTIRYCSIAMIALVLFGEAFFLLPQAEELPQAITMGLLVIIPSALAATVASMFEKSLQIAIVGKPERQPIA